MFDGRGWVLKIDTTATPSPAARPGGGPLVRLRLAEPRSAREEDLIRLLKEYLQACGERIRPGAPLSDLIRRCRSIQLYRE
jgi:hypothetical protein